MEATAPEAAPSPVAAALKAPVPKADKYIWAIYVFLLIVSVVELYSASSREVQASNIFDPIIRHGRLLLLGFGLTWGISRVRYHWFRALIPFFGIFAVIVGTYVFFKGDIINGARRSTTLLGIPLQSSELLKLAVVLFIAWIMAKHQERKGVKTEGVIWSAVAVVVCSGILFTQGLTNTLLLMCVSFAMMLIAGVQWKRFGIVLGVYALCGAGFYIVKEHKDNKENLTKEQIELNQAAALEEGKGTADRTNIQKGRLAMWLGDSIPKYRQRVTSANRQEMYSYMAQARGGLHGVLPGNSRETARLPLAFSDYIFAIVVEDWGLIGGLALLLAYLSLLLRAGAIAYRCSITFPALLVMGMAVMIVMQALIHMAIVTGVGPVSGQPLPLISKGGSSIIVTSIAFGIMLSVSRYAVQRKKGKEMKAEMQNLPEDMRNTNPAQQ